MKERLYFEPDRFAQEPDYYPHGHDAGIPIISAIGRGPKGKSVTAEKQGNTLIIKDEDGNVVATFENLTAPSISISQHIEEIVAGQEASLDVSITNPDGTKTTSTIIIPCGRDGSRIYQCFETIDVYHNNDSTFAATHFDDIFFGPNDGTTMPPRTGDLVYAKYNDGGWYSTQLGAIYSIVEDEVTIVLVPWDTGRNAGNGDIRSTKE